MGAKVVRDQSGNSTRAPDYGRGTHEIAATDDPDEQAKIITRRIRATFTTPTYAPPVLPVAALEVHQLSQAKNVKLEQVLSALEKDPLLAARVLKVANSPLYTGAPLQSLHHAVLRIGMKNLASVVWEVALNMRVFRCKVYEQPMEQIRRHSTAVAHLARLVAQQTSIPLDYAFLCGLLHDVGAAAILLLLGERQPGQAQELLAPEVLAQVMEDTHAEASALIAKIWKLPGDLQLVLEHHHQITSGGYAHPTAAVIALAQKLALEEGPRANLHMPDWDETPLSGLMAAEAALSIENNAFDRLRKKAEPLLAELA
ncbi:MAG TPA: HDOD domain-containing protein, partial [Polyangiales bacterium]|nr:HDOD domain-containing protein [Polyangiales bacterium]